MRITVLTTFSLLLVPVFASAGLITTIYDAGLGTLPELQGFVSQVATADNPHVSGGVLDERRRANRSSIGGVDPP